MGTLGLFLAALLMVSCGGSKNKVTAEDGNTVLAVRTFENDGSTEVALLNGNFDSEDEAREAAENAQWVPAENFPLGDDIDFLEMNSDSEGFSEVARDWNDNERRRKKRRRRARRKRWHNGYSRWRPHRHRDSDNWNSWTRVKVTDRYPSFYDCGYDGFWYGSWGCVEPFSHTHGFHLKVSFTFRIRTRIGGKKRRKSWEDDSWDSDHCMVRFYR